MNELRKKFKEKEFKKHKTEKKLKTKILGTYFSVNQPNMGTKIIGTTLIIIGMVFLIDSVFLETIGIGFLINSIYLIIKIGVTLLIIGILIILIAKEKIISITIQETQITIVTIAWILSLFFITENSDLEIFFILILIGMLLLKEGTDDLTTIYFKNRMNIFISVFFIVFVAFIGKKVISI